MGLPGEVRAAEPEGEATNPVQRLRLHAGMARQGLRYALAGCIVAAVYILTTTLLASALGLPFQAALFIGFGTAIVVHFTLQRVFVWARHEEEFALPVHRQVGRYLLMAGAQYGVTAVSVALLPGALGLPTEVVYVATAMLTGSINFLVFRNRIFHATSTVALTASGPAAKNA